MFTVSDQWLMKHSRAGAWTRNQFEAIGLSWPPVHGWKRDAVGRIITDTQKRRFEQALRSKAARCDSTMDLFR
jgi:hypothetical protein